MGHLCQASLSDGQPTHGGRITGLLFNFQTSGTTNPLQIERERKTDTKREKGRGESGERGKESERGRVRGKWGERGKLGDRRTV